MVEAKQSRQEQGQGEAMAPIRPHAAAVDVGATLHVAAVGPGADAEPVHSFGTRRGVAPIGHMRPTPRNGRRRPPYLPGDLPYARALRTQDRKLLPFRKQQMSPAERLC